LYYIRNWQLLFEGIEYVLKQPTNKGEYYLTDAFQYMIDKGAKIRAIDVHGWYDAGKLDTLLETTQVILGRGAARRPDNVDKASTVIDPVYVEAGVTIRNSKIGPNVSIGKGSTIEDCELRDTIVGVKSKLSQAKLSNSLVGDDVVLSGVNGEVNVGDHSEVRASIGKA
jgi:glucose-1-phosphate thymidylyltransferase